MTAQTSSYKALLAQREALVQQITAARKAEVVKVVQEIQTLSAEFGLTPEDLFPQLKQKRASATSSVDPKYRDPATGQTWTGRGMPPIWIKDKDRSLFAI